MPSSLPIDSLLPRILDYLSQFNNLILQASPGSGKTTRVPPALLHGAWRKEKEIWVLVPRRLAAKAAACRIAEEMNEKVGDRVGYHFRFEKVVSPKTQLKFLTEGLFIRLLMQDPELKNVGLVILDEFHERHLHTDLALGILRHLQKTKRPDLKLLVMSATLDTSRLENYLGTQKIFLDQPLHPVAVDYLQQPSKEKLEHSVVQAVSKALTLSSKGDVLVFLPGMYEIRRCESLLQEKYRDLTILALHGDLPREEQDLIFQPSSKRKVILSTNIAESSLTIPGVTTVIDSGLHRQAQFSPWTGVPSLKVKSISKASAIQRMGRAGRTGPGHCLRLYTRSDFDGRLEFDKPEILRVDFSQTLLELKRLGVDISTFEWFECPPTASLATATTLLFRLGALEKDAVESPLTPLGQKMAVLPLHPRLSRFLLAAEERDILEPAIRLAALISEGELEDLDALEMLEKRTSSEVLRKLESQIASSFSSTHKSRNVSASDKTKLSKALLFAFPDRIAKKRKGSQELVFCLGGTAAIPQHSLFQTHEYFIVLDAWEKQKVTATSLVAIEPEWLFEFPLLREETETFWDEGKKRVISMDRIFYGDLILSENKSDSVEKTEIFLKEGLGISGSLDVHAFLKKLTEAGTEPDIESLLTRLEILRKQGKTYLPELTSDVLLALAKHLAKDCDRLSVFLEKNLLEEALFYFSETNPNLHQQLHRLTPLQAELAGGRKVKIHYSWLQDPWIESRLQDFFGMKEGPKILEGRLPLTLHLLAPNRRPVQVTRDLPSFWKNTYPEIRNQLARKYPRHSWPEKP